jgi:hypothetical protein
MRDCFGRAARSDSPVVPLLVSISPLSLYLVLAIQMPIMAGSQRRPSDDDACRERMLAPGVCFYEKTGYGLITEENARRAWDAIEKVLRKDKVVSSAPFQATLFVHHYSVEDFNLNTAQWVVLLATKAGANQSKAKTIVYQFDYESLALEKVTRLGSRTAKPIDQSAAVRAMDQRPRAKHDELDVSVEQIDRAGSFYLLFQEASDFGLTAAVSQQSGELVFYATTVAHGTGKRIVPK